MLRTKKLLAITGLSLFTLAGALMLNSMTPARAEAAAFSKCPRTSCMFDGCRYTGALSQCIGEPGACEEFSC